MKAFASLLSCLLVVSMVAGCGGPTVPEQGEGAEQGTSVEGQLEATGTSEEDYQKAMQEGYQQSQGR